MAKQRFGINDAYRGTVGTVIGYEWRGKWCLRAKPVFVKNPRTEAQQMNRELFREAVRFAGRMTSVLRLSLRTVALDLGMTECNRMVQLNHNCFAFDDEGQLKVDYASLVVAEGPVAPVAFSSLEVAEGCVKGTFERNPLHVRADSEDEVFVVALCPEAGDYCLSAPTLRRRQKVVFCLPDEWEGKEVHFYCFVRDYLGRASESQYLGCLVDGMGEALDGTGNGVDGEQREDFAFEDVASNDTIMRVVGGLEGGAVAHDELGVGGDHALGAPQDSGDELRE
ncbi:MAG: hypothetical protein IJ634_03970 [Bacteroidales bacterium]|nr:hypothetical protein [Bacteroidales bacterium]